MTLNDCPLSQHEQKTYERRYRMSQNKFHDKNYLKKANEIKEKRDSMVELLYN